MEFPILQFEEFRLPQENYWLHMLRASDLSAMNKTRSLFHLFLVLFIHLRHVVNLCRYSFIHALQNIFVAVWTALCFQEVSRDSISWRNVHKDYFVNNLSRTLTFNTSLADSITDSQALPIHGLTRELKTHAVWQWLTNCLFTFHQDF